LRSSLREQNLSKLKLQEGSAGLKSSAYKCKARWRDELAATRRKANGDEAKSRV